MNRAAWLILVALVGCKRSPEPAASKPECVKSVDCPARQSCEGGRCVAEAPLLDDSPCGRALANVDRLNTAQGRNAVDLDLPDLMIQCKGWPPEHATCLEQAQDMRAWRACSERIMDLERARLKAKKAAMPQGDKAAPVEGKARRIVTVPPPAGAAPGYGAGTVPPATGTAPGLGAGGATPREPPALSPVPTPDQAPVP